MFVYVSFLSLLLLIGRMPPSGEHLLPPAHKLFFLAAHARQVQTTVVSRPRAENSVLPRPEPAPRGRAPQPTETSSQEAASALAWGIPDKDCCLRVLEAELWVSLGIDCEVQRLVPRSLRSACTSVLSRLVDIIESEHETKLVKERECSGDCPVVPSSCA